jgi:hypothetical protein
MATIRAKSTHITMMGTKNCVIMLMTSPGVENGKEKLENGN